MDRFIQQAVMPVLQAQWDPTFSDSSFGFRPGRNAHQAVKRAQSYLKEGYTWVVDMDLEKFFDRVNHDKVMSEVSKRVQDGRVLTLIHRFLKAGAMEHEALHETVEGVPQGGPLSPLLSNLILDRLDRELEQRGHRFVRYADDSNVYVRSKRAGYRVLGSLSRFLSTRLKLKVNEAKSAVGRPWERTFLGFRFTRRDLRRCISPEAVKRLKERVRDLTRRPGAGAQSASPRSCAGISSGGRLTLGTQRSGPSSRNGTRGFRGAFAAICGSNGGGAGTRSYGNVGSVETWHGTRQSPPRVPGA